MKIHFKTAIPRRNYDYEPYDSNGDPKQLDKQGFSRTTKTNDNQQEPEMKNKPTGTLILLRISEEQSDK